MHRSNQSGSAIIIVLIISIVAFLITLFTVKLSKELVTSSYMLFDKLKAKFGAESTIEKLKFYIKTGKPGYNTITNNVPGMPKKIYLDGRVVKIDNASVQITDSGGMLSVFVLDSRLIKGLLKANNVSNTRITTIVDSLKDWYDRDSNPNLNGAEAFYYRRKGCKYTPRNFPGVQSIYEWHIVRGLTDNKTFSAIKPYLILTPSWHLNINTMDAKMLSSALGVPMDIARNLVKYRLKKGHLTSFDIERAAGKSNVLNEIISSFPTLTLDIKVDFRFNEAMEKVECQLYYQSDNVTPFRILKWQN